MELLYGQLVHACSKWKRDFGGNNFRAWRLLVSRSSRRGRRFPTWEVGAAGELRVWWLRWRASHHRCCRLARTETGLRAPQARLRLAHHTWRTLVLSAPLLRRERYFALRYWFGRWCWTKVSTRLKSVDCVTVARQQRKHNLARQWMRCARVCCDATRLCWGVALVMGTHCHQRRALRNWARHAHTASDLHTAAICKIQLVSHGLWWGYWRQRLQLRSFARQSLYRWRGAAWVSVAHRHLWHQRSIRTLRQWYIRCVVVIERRRRTQVAVEKFSAHRCEIQRRSQLAGVMGRWLRFCNRQLAWRTAAAFAVRHSMQQGPSARLRTAMVSWHRGARRLGQVRRATATAVRYSRLVFCRRCLAGWRRTAVAGRQVKSRRLTASLAEAHRGSVLLEQMWQAWRRWVCRLHALDRQAVSLAVGVHRERSLRGTIRQWWRCARRVSESKHELACLHLRKRILERALSGLCTAVRWHQQLRRKQGRLQSWDVMTGHDSQLTEPQEPLEELTVSGTAQRSVEPASWRAPGAEVDSIFQGLAMVRGMLSRVDGEASSVAQPVRQAAAAADTFAHAEAETAAAGATPVLRRSRGRRRPTRRKTTVVSSPQPPPPFPSSPLASARSLWAVETKSAAVAALQLGKFNQLPTVSRPRSVATSTCSATAATATNTTDTASLKLMPQELPRTPVSGQAQGCNHSAAMEGNAWLQVGTVVGRGAVQDFFIEEPTTILRPHKGSEHEADLCGGEQELTVRAIGAAWWLAAAVKAHDVRLRVCPFRLAPPLLCTRLLGALYRLCKRLLRVLRLPVLH